MADTKIYDEVAALAAQLLEAPSHPNRLIHRSVQTIRHKPQGIQKVRLPARIRPHQKHQRTQLDIAMLDAAVIPKLHAANHEGQCHLQTSIP